MASGGQQPNDLRRVLLGHGWVAGNLTADPRVMFTGTGTLIVSLRVAASERVKDPETGAWKEGPVRYIDLKAFGRLGENIAEHLVKGDRIVAGGTWQREFWTSTEGQQHQRLSLIARDLGPSMVFRAARWIDTMIGEAR